MIENPIPNLGAQPLPDTAKALLDGAMDAARQCFEQDSVNHPVLLFAKGSDSSGLSATGLTKVQLSDVINTLLNNGFAVVFVHEAWLGKVPQSVGQAIIAGDDAVEIAPRDQPDRQEAVVVRLYVMEGDKERIVQAAGMIERPKEGKPLLGEWRLLDSATPGMGFRPRTYGSPDARLASGNI